ncbi:MAG: hypothetical protein ACLP8S_25830 [Solirubrobacteraceae bacterium]
MHAVVIPAKFNDPSAAKAELDGLVAQVSGMPGFVAGYWVALPEDTGTALIVFDSEGAAQALADFARSAPAGSVTAGNIEVGEVWAHA